MALFADSSAIETASLPSLVAVAGLGALIVIYRVAILDWWKTTIGAKPGDSSDVPSSSSGGYGWLLIGLVGVVFWFADQL
jgi:hypothetical protein